MRKQKATVRLVIKIGNGFELLVRASFVNKLIVDQSRIKEEKVDKAVFMNSTWCIEINKIAIQQKILIRMAQWSLAWDAQKRMKTGRPKNNLFLSTTISAWFLRIRWKKGDPNGHIEIFIYCYSIIGSIKNFDHRKPSEKHWITECQKSYRKISISEFWEKNLKNMSEKKNLKKS